MGMGGKTKNDGGYNYPDRKMDVHGRTAPPNVDWEELAGHGNFHRVCVGCILDSFVRNNKPDSEIFKPKKM
jgi:hypothetical protein